jgi:hypothetical protein
MAATKRTRKTDATYRQAIHEVIDKMSPEALAFIAAHMISGFHEFMQTDKTWNHEARGLHEAMVEALETEGFNYNDLVERVGL